jgi:hypothetical protein
MVEEKLQPEEILFYALVMTMLVLNRETSNSLSIIELI